MLPVVFCFLSASLCLSFLDIARYACKKTDENTLNIKQKYRLNPNNLFGFKFSVFSFRSANICSKAKRCKIIML